MSIFPPDPIAQNTYLPPSPVVAMALNITNITQSYPMVITVTIGPNQIQSYVIGQLVALTVPPSYGMVQANGITCQILAINGLDFSVSVNSTNFDPFVLPASGKEQPASLSSAGSRNLYNNTNVPFHSLNGMTGN